MQVLGGQAYLCLALQRPVKKKTPDAVLYDLEKM